MKSFVAMARGDFIDYFRRTYPYAFSLAAEIADGTQWNDAPNKYGLKRGQAILPSIKTLGWERGVYREAIRKLQKENLATFITSPRGTIASLNDDRLFDPIFTGKNVTPQNATNFTANQQPTENPINTGTESQSDNEVQPTSQPSCNQATTTSHTSYTSNTSKPTPQAATPLSSGSDSLIPSKPGVTEEQMRKFIALRTPRNADAYVANIPAGQILATITPRLSQSATKPKAAPYVPPMPTEIP